MRKHSFMRIMAVLAATLLVAACGSDKKEAKIAIGPPGSETNHISQLILAAYGIEEGDYKQYKEGFGDASDLLQDGNIDITMSVVGVPAGGVESLQASTGDVQLLSMSDEAIDKVSKDTGYSKLTITPDDYKFLDGDVNTIAAFAIMVANTHTIDEELGYELTKYMIEGASEITHAQSKQMTLENALNGAEGLPIHPGAKRYYEEQGLTVDNPVAELTADPEERKSELDLGTGSQGGTYYPLGGEIANVWNKYLGEVNVTNKETGASVENLSSISRDKMDLGMTVHVPALNALKGEGDFKDHPVDNAAFIGHVYPEVVHIVTRKARKIDSLDELK